MPYIGNNLATQFQAFATQTITGDGSTGYTLDRAVANGKELLVYINNVKQEEGSSKSYTASGTTITFSAAVASTDSCYVVFLGSAVQTVTAPAGSIVSSQFSSADLVLPKTVTIGSAGAEDTKLVFDGNAQDFHIGLDDSADDLVIGKGSALGTTTHMSFDENGQVLKPLQCAFLVQKNAHQTSIPTGSYQDVTFQLERYDVGGNFASNTFTAPVTGKYQLNLNLRIDAIDKDGTYILLYLTTSNRGYYQLMDANIYSSDIDFWCFSMSVVADMDANDTASSSILVAAGAAQSQIDGATGDSTTNFSGYLLG